MMLKSLMLIFVTSVISTCAFGQSTTRVQLVLQTPANISAGQTQVSFQLIDTQTSKSVTPTELNITNQKALHFIAYDPGLKEFQHVHPAFDGKVWSVNMSFTVNGNYFVWAQGELASGTVDFNALTRIVVTGGQPAWPSPNLPDVRAGSDSGSIATLSADVLKAGQMSMLMLDFTRTDGTPPQITPYLGAFAHVIATPEDGSSLTHVHPMSGSNPDQGMLHLDFPTAGAYRLWVEFNDGGVLRTVPLSVIVN